MTLPSIPRALRPAGLCLAAVLLPYASAQAAEPTTLVLQWGDALAGVAQTLTEVLVPVLIAATTALLARVAGPLRFLITNALVERLVRNATDYGLNAVAGAVRGRTLTVPLGSAVLARSVERALEQGPSWLVTAAGGRHGIAEKVFRSLSLDEGATLANTLRPALRGSAPGAADPSR